MAEPIYVVAYPKSGSTWLSRLLGDALNSPVQGVGEAVPLGREGQDRTGNYVVFQTHLKAFHRGNAESLTPNPYTFNLDQYTNQIVIYLVRDPRAVAVSAMFYWEIESVAETMDAMYHGLQPIGYHYPSFVESWFDAPVYCLRYEDLLDDPETELKKLFEHFGIRYSIRRLRRAIE